MGLKEWSLNSTTEAMKIEFCFIFTQTTLFVIGRGAANTPDNVCLFREEHVYCTFTSFAALQKSSFYMTSFFIINLRVLFERERVFAAVKTSYTVGDTTFAYLLFPAMMETKVHVLGQK